jgi:hypothetical protein
VSAFAVGILASALGRPVSIVYPRPSNEKDSLADTIDRVFPSVSWSDEQTVQATLERDTHEDMFRFLFADHTSSNYEDYGTYVLTDVKGKPEHRWGADHFVPLYSRESLDAHQKGKRAPKRNASGKGQRRAKKQKT